MEFCECGLCKEYASKENVIANYEHFFLMFNRYPYLPGHVMLVPKRPVKSLPELSSTERIEMIDRLAEVQEKILKCLKELDVTSTNIGLNTGENSGASIPQHLHVHIVPRKPNDTNFMHVVNSCQPFQYPGAYRAYRKQILREFNSTSPCM
jgi:ATP adenylyltransferase